MCQVCKFENKIKEFTSMIYLIRHGESMYNKASVELKEKHGEKYRSTQDYLGMKFGRQFLDAELTEHGIKQCLATKQIMKHINVDLVIVSPLKRALKTCDIIFDGHKSNPIILVDPAFRQLLSSSNDIGNKVNQSKIEFPTFDFSLVTDPDYWYLTNLQDKQLKQKLLSTLDTSKGQSKNQLAIELTLEFMRQNYQEKVKYPEKKQQLIRKVLPSLQHQKQILLNHLQKYRSIAVVSHCQNIRAYTGHKIKNCEVFPLTEQNLINLNTTQ